MFVFSKFNMKQISQSTIKLFTYYLGREVPTWIWIQPECSREQPKQDPDKIFSLVYFLYVPLLNSSASKV